MNQTRKRTRDISKFIRGRPVNTARSYSHTLVSYLSWIYGENEVKKRDDGDRMRVELQHYDELAIDYLNSDRDIYDYGDDLRDYLRDCSDRAPTTLATRKSIITSWLGENHTYLPGELTRRIKVGGRRPITRDRIATPKELRRILSHSDLMMKTYLLVLTSSGIRPGEGLGIQWSDVDLERGMIHIPRELSKNGMPRNVFISLEAMESLEEWIQYFDAYVEKADSYTPSDYERDTSKVFPLGYYGMRDKYTRVLERANLAEQDPNTNIRVLRLHTMRKYFRTRLPAGGCNLDVVEALLGHEGYLGGAYVRLTDEEIEAEYRKAEHSLWIFKTKPINEDELRDLERENLLLRNEVADIRREIATMNAMQQDVAANPEALQKLAELIRQTMAAEESEND